MMGQSLLYLFLLCPHSSFLSMKWDFGRAGRLDDLFTLRSVSPGSRLHRCRPVPVKASTVDSRLCCRPRSAVIEMMYSAPGSRSVSVYELRSLGTVTSEAIPEDGVKVIR